MIAATLRRIEAELARISAELADGHLVPADDVDAVRRQVLAQAEMLEQGLDQ